MQNSVCQNSSWSQLLWGFKWAAHIDNTFFFFNKFCNKGFAVFHEGKGSSLFPYRHHLEHTYGSDMCAFHIEVFKMWPEILLIEKRNIKNLRRCTVIVGTNRSYISVVHVSASAFFLKRSSDFFIGGRNLMTDKRILLDRQSVTTFPYNTPCCPMNC